MEVSDFLSRADELFAAAQIKPWRPVTNLEAAEYFENLVWIATNELDKYHRDLFSPWFKEFLESLAWVRGEFQRLRDGDPGAFYKPQHDVSRRFHQSMALWRFFCAGNRCSKTQSGYQEDYWVATNQHPYRTIPLRKQAVAIIGTTYQKYSVDVFEPKMITGETSNPISPYFPPGGKWLKSFNRKNYRIILACPECAGAGQASKCTHTSMQSTISLYSDEGGAAAIMGAQFGVLHLDEHVDVSFFNEGEQRISTVSHSSGIITGSPLYGKGVWEHQIVQARAEGPPENNRRFPSMGRNSPPYAEFFTIDQYSAGIRDKDTIDAMAQGMPAYEFKARIMGIPTSLAENPVFDQNRITAAERACEALTWKKGVLLSDVEDLATVHHIGPLRWVEDGVGNLNVRESPESSAQYVIGVDTAAGLQVGSERNKPDFSCAQVFKLGLKDKLFCLEQVAEWHGHLRPTLFADEVKKLGLWYNGAWLVIETTGGLGAAVLDRLRNQIYYPKIFQDKSKPTQPNVDIAVRFGLDTNVSTKPTMVASMQHMFAQGRLVVQHPALLDEMIAFTQTATPSGRTIRFEASAGSKDDRVMATALCTYAIQQNPWLWDWDNPEQDRRWLPPEDDLPGERLSRHTIPVSKPAPWNIWSAQ